MVYVDGVAIKFRGMLMCHMIADTEVELLEFAKRIGLKEEYWQNKGTYKSHFDISKGKKELAIREGAILLNRKDFVTILRRKREELKKRLIMSLFCYLK